MARSLTDTIAAIATPPGEGGIAIIRVSGPDARATATRLLRTRDGSPAGLSPRRVSLCLAVTAEDSLIDEVLTLWMPAPGSYTREDVLEIHSHGGRSAANSILKEILKTGVRLADPGEFTLRAFLRGRIDLVQAEAVADIIKAGSQNALQIHESLLEGKLSAEIARWQDSIIHVLTLIESLLDFPEEELAEPDFAALSGRLAALIEMMRAKIATHAFGRVAREGFHIAIVGAPNVGKSNLFNRIIDEERAIVSPRAGTTRDTIEIHANVCGVPVRMIDTAGLRDSGDAIEIEGISRARKAAETADLVIYVFDAGRVPTEAELLEASFLASLGRPFLLVANKVDLNADLSALPDGVFPVSALNGDGVDGLLFRIRDHAWSGKGPAAEGALTRERHRVAVEEALGLIESARFLLEGKGPLDAAASDLQRALASLRGLLGWGVPEDVLDRIFQEFCIGK